MNALDNADLSLPVCLGKTASRKEFDEIRVGRFTRISFHRTLRIPEDGREYPLPAGLGRLPIHRVEDFAQTAPVEWLAEGGFFIPLYQKEALFLQFHGPEWHPTIAKICVGRINAITGKPYSESLSRINQDYVVIPNQQWLDGVCSGEGVVKQFVAMPLGQGYTIESQFTDEEKFGGFQIVVFDAFPARFPERDPDTDQTILDEFRPRVLYQMAEPTMGVAAGGSIRQQIHKDTHGVESWDPRQKRRLTIHLVNSLAYKEITGLEPPASPITSVEYQRANIPWYSYYDESAPIVKPPSIFKRILTVTGIAKKRGIDQSDDLRMRHLVVQQIHKIRTPDKIEASVIHRKRAYDARARGYWQSAIREISYVIDLNVDTCADDFALRSSCNYQLGRYRDGSIDGSLGLRKDRKCVDALSWRAFCREKLGEHKELDDDADALLEIPETELLGLEMKAEAALLAGRFDDALKAAMKLKFRHAGHIRAEQICDDANKKLL